MMFVENYRRALLNYGLGPLCFLTMSSLAKSQTNQDQKQLEVKKSDPTEPAPNTEIRDESQKANQIPKWILDVLNGTTRCGEIQPDIKKFLNAISAGIESNADQSQAIHFVDNLKAFLAAQPLVGGDLLPWVGGCHTYNISVIINPVSLMALMKAHPETIPSAEDILKYSQGRGEEFEAALHRAYAYAIGLDTKLGKQHAEMALKIYERIYRKFYSAKDDEQHLALLKVLKLPLPQRQVLFEVGCAPEGGNQISVLGKGFDDHQVASLKLLVKSLFNVISLHSPNHNFIDHNEVNLDQASKQLASEKKLQNDLGRTFKDALNLIEKFKSKPTTSDNGGDQLGTMASEEEVNKIIKKIIAHYNLEVRTDYVYAGCLGWDI